MTSVPASSTLALNAEVEEVAGIFPGAEDTFAKEQEKKEQEESPAKGDDSSDDSSDDEAPVNEFEELESELDVIENPITATDLYTKPHLMGMPATYLAVGVIYGGQGAILYPMYELVLQEPQNYQGAIASLTAVFWSFKIFYGFISDSVPIFGMRRKPYILGGWFFSCLTTAIQAIYLASNTTKLACFYAPIGTLYEERNDAGVRLGEVNTYDESNHDSKIIGGTIDANVDGSLEGSVSPDGSGYLYDPFQDFRLIDECYLKNSYDFVIKNENGEEVCNPNLGTYTGPRDTSADYVLYFESLTVDPLTFDGSLYAALMVTTNLMYMFATVSADGLAVEYAKREPYDERGRIQSYNYVCRFFTTTITTAMSGFALNTPIYSGTYKTGLDFSTYIWILFTGQAIFLPFWIIMHEDKVDPKELTSIATKLGDSWKLLQNKAFCSLMIFNVMFNCFTSVGYVGSRALANRWVGVTALYFSWASIITYIAISATVYINGKYFVTYSWRCLQSFGLITSSIMGLLTLIIIYDINRSPFFWIFTNVDQTILQMIGWLTSIWATNEMAPRGLEGTALAISTTSGNAAQTLAQYITNQVGGLFDNLNTAGALQEQTYNGILPEQEETTRREFTYNLLIAMAINLCGLAFMWLLPHQKAQARRRFETWGSSAPFGALGLGIIAMAMFYGTTTTVYTIVCPCSEFPAGGPGCKPDTCEYEDAVLGDYSEAKCFDEFPPLTVEATPAPTAGEVEATPAPTAGEVEATLAPTAGEVEATLAPTAGEVEATPAPTAGEVEATPAPTAGEVEATPAPTAGEIEATPAPTAGEVA